MGLFFDYCILLLKEFILFSYFFFYKRLVRGFLILLLNGMIDEIGCDNFGLYWFLIGIDVVKRLCIVLYDVIYYFE